MKVFAATLVLSSLLMTGTAFAEEPATTETKIQEIKKDNQEVKEAKEKLVKDKEAGVSKDQIKSDRKELKKARRARHEMKKQIQSEKSVKQ